MMLQDINNVINTKKFRIGPILSFLVNIVVSLGAHLATLLQ